MSTLKQLQKMKLSGLFEVVLEDLKMVKKLHIRINMNSWLVQDGHWTLIDGFVTKDPRNKTDICTVCLGGAACLGLIKPPPSYAKYDKIWKDQDSLVINFRSIFDNFRNGYYYTLLDCFNSFTLRPQSNTLEFRDYVASHEDQRVRNVFLGVLEGEEYEKLIKDIKSFIKHLQKKGY
jgi:hypothetical protein